MSNPIEQAAIDQLVQAAQQHSLQIAGGKVRRTSSRFCLGVEHGDYNGTELFGVGTDRFIWLGYKSNNSSHIRVFSQTFPQDGVVDLDLNAELPQPGSHTHSWARFLFGAVYVLRREGFSITHGFDGSIVANIPGGGMSRSASLSLNLLLTVLEVNGHKPRDDWQVVDMAKALENDFIGSPCGNLDQIMIYFAKAGHGTHYVPSTRAIHHIPLQSNDLRFVSLDTGTDRPGLDKSTYKVRRAECDQFAELLAAAGLGSCLGDVRDDSAFEQARTRFADTHPNLFARLDYIFHAQRRFALLMDAWRRGDIDEVGRVFREDGHGLRDHFVISGPELETMCDIVRTVPGVLGERMLGGDKGAAGALIRADAEPALRQAVDTAFPRAYPALREKYAVHTCCLVDGVTVLDGRL